METQTELMAFYSVPAESKNQINKAGKILSGRIPNSITDEFENAIKLTSKWRACHAYPINTFQSTLRTKLKNGGYINYIVAQRLKRLPTIIDKLKRYPAMQLTTMQDIGGVRAILNTVKDVYNLRKEYAKSIHFKPMLINEYDYINHPRNEDGYRSLHLVFKYKNIQNPNYDDLKIEMQIRTKLQHAWATAVETMGTFLGQALKSRQGDKKWIDFFALASSAFAYMEGFDPVPRFSNLSKQKTYQKIKEVESQLGALEKMRGFSVAINAIHKQGGKGTSYYLIVLDSIKQTVSFKPYDRDSFQDAIKDYSEIELEVTQGKKVEPVLVSAGPIESLRKAYPNFFLDTTEFTKTLSSIMPKGKK